MQIDQLHYFLESYKRKNFTKAAEHLFVTPQAVSRSVIELENELNLTLFERRGNKIQPTPYADSLAASAKKILEATDEFLAVATDLSSKSVKGTFRVAVASTFNVGETIAQKRLQQLKSLLEHATMEITEHTNEGCISLVQEGMADIAIGIGRFELPGLIVEPVKNLEIALAVSSDNPLASLNCITAKELLSLTLAMPMNTSALLPSLQKLAKKHRTELAPFAPVQIRKSQREEFLLSGG